MTEARRYDPAGPAKTRIGRETMARKPNPLVITGALGLAAVAGVTIALYANAAQTSARNTAEGTATGLDPASLTPAALTNAVSGSIPDFLGASGESAEAPSGPRIEGGGTPFRDEFDRFRSDRWNISHGWRNGKWAVNDWRRSQARFGDGLTMTLEPRLSPEAEYAGAELQSRRRFGHGYFEVRMRAARASGTVSSFFTYTGPPFGDPWNEIDVEILGAKTREVMFTYFRDGKKIEHIHPLDFDAAADFHTYGFDWQPGHLRWYVDGELAHEASPSELALPNVNQKLMTSIWGSETLTDWVGPFDKSALPARMVITCISYAQDYASRTSCEAGRGS